MLVVTVELWPQGDKSRKRTLCAAVIANDGTSESPKTIGHYRYMLSKRGEQINQPWREGGVLGFPRLRLGVWDLLYRVLRDAVQSRNP